MAETKTAEATTPLNLYQKLAAITGEIGEIKKGGRNREQGFDFIEYAAVAGKLRTLFAKYGVVVIPRMAQTKNQHRENITSKAGKAGQSVLVDMTFTVVNADDPNDKFTVPWTGEAVDYGDKATNKAATSALKYFLMRQFNVSEKGDDPDEQEVGEIQHRETAPPRASTTRPPSDKQIGMIKGLAKRKGKDAEWIESVLAATHTSADASAVIDKLNELEDAQ